MSPLRILSFRNYHGINEEETGSSTSAAKTILDLFFQAYSALYGKAKNYKDADVNKDLLAIKNSPVEQKGDAITNAINKISPEVSTVYIAAADKMIDASKEIKNAYDLLLTTEEGKKDLAEINTAVSAKLIDFAKSLKAVEATSESLEYINENIFSKNIYPKARKTLVDTIDPLIATLTGTVKGPSSEAVKAKAQTSLTALTKIKEELADDEVWKKMSKSERKKRIKDIPLEIQKIQQDQIEYQAKTIETQGFDQKVGDSIKKANALIIDAIEILGKEEVKELDKIENEEGGEQLTKDKEGGDPGEDSDIDVDGDSGNTVNASEFKPIKSGTESDEVKDLQVKINKLLPKIAKIEPNGKYDANTEKAIKKLKTVYTHTAPAIFGKMDGKSITPGLQAYLANLDANGDDIIKLMVYKKA